MNYKVNGLKGPKAETEYLLVYKIKEARARFQLFPGYIMTLFYFYYYYFFYRKQNL